MRKYFRWAFLSLLTALAVLVIDRCLRSYVHVESIELFWGLRPHSVYRHALAANTLRAEHYRGHTRLWFVDEVCPPSEFQPDSSGKTRHWRYTWNQELGLNIPISSGPPEAAVLGFHYRGYQRNGSTRMWILWFPDYACIVVLGSLPVYYAATSFRHFWRGKHKICAVCGYDLRATPNRCPECGKAVTSTSTTATPPPIS
jgi:hypothetical protein